MSYPGNYGFVPHTLSEDGDPIDVLVINTRELVPGKWVKIGDWHGERTAKRLIEEAIDRARS